MTEEKDSQLESESEAERLYLGAKQQLISLATNMQLIIPRAHIAQLFLATGLAVLLTYGPEPARKWLQTALASLDDDPKVH
jgi:hypothetical protein